jgi:hypothetical protein
MHCTPTAIASLGAITMLCMASVDEVHPPLNTANTAARVSALGQDKPWQTDDGVIHHKGQTYDTWREFHAVNQRIGDLSRRCGVPNYDIDDWRNMESFLPPSDCSMSNTNPAAEYDPSVNLLRIACVVHVIRNSNGSQGNISEANVQSGIRILNEDVKALTGTNGQNGTDCQIEFYLAEADPNGNQTNGITYSNNTTWYNDGGSYYESLAWDPSRYMNIYTNTASGNLGYVPWLPQESFGNPGSNSDRVVVLWESYGENAPIGPPFNLGRTLTHEVGHYLGLHHTFNDGCGSNCSSSGDLICDTSPQPSSTSGCNGSSCSGVAPDDNYMDYSDDICMEKFTPDQSRRMRCTILNYRPEIAQEGEGEIDYISLEQVGTNPTLVDPAGVSLQVRINELETDGYVDGSGRLVYSDGETSLSVPLSNQGGNNFGATTSTLECGSVLSWHFTAVDAGGTVLRLPTGTDNFSATVALGFETSFSDDGESDPGYAVSSTGSDGGWDRGAPVSCERGAPANDADGSGQCWLTDNSAADECDSDVDGGYSRLVSPPMDATGGNATVSYARHFSSTPDTGNCPAGFTADCEGTCFPQAVYDDWQGDGVCDSGGFIPSEYGYEGSPPGVAVFMNCASFNCDDGDCTGCGSTFAGEADYLSVEITSNGTAWVEMDRIQTGDTNSEGGWVSKSFAVDSFVTPSATVQVRFTAVDVGTETILEAAMDGLTMENLICDDSPACLGDIDENGVIDGSDLSQILGFWGQSGVPADLNVDGDVDGLDLAILLGGWGACSG